jgi:proteasome lid subunit RPN8/RPN11
MKSMARKLIINSQDIERIRMHALRCYPEECCGFLIGNDGTRRVHFVLEASNIAPVRNNRYTIAPEDIIRAERTASARSLSVLGYYHSHPDHPAVPSEYDRQHAWPSYSYLIVKVMNGATDGLRSWTLTDAGRFVEEQIEVSVEEIH